MLTLFSNNYTKEDYEFLFELLVMIECKNTGKACKHCPAKRACDDLDRLIGHIEEKLLTN